MKICTFISLLLALVASILFLVIPTYNGETRSEDAEGHTTVTQTHATLLEVNGRWALLSLGIPVVIALIPVLIPERGVRIGAAVLLCVFALITGFTTGLFYLPSVLTMIVAAVLGGGAPGPRPTDSSAYTDFMNGFSLRLVNLAAILILIPAKPATAPDPKLFFQRGVNFTAEGPVGYDPQAALPVLDRLKSYGVDSLAFVPYGFAESREPVIHFGHGGMERTQDIEALTALAHQRGMKVLLKPQLWTRGGFPGNLEFPDPRRRAQWFAEYRKFMEYYATAAARMHADLFSVGVELSKMTPYDAEWRVLIARARELYPGPLVYCATQGPEFETIRFWDALDYIGLNEYYPLPDNLSTADLVRTVESVQNKFTRPVIFTEAGFCTYAHPNRAPWDETPRELAPADQARCYDAVFKAFYSKPWFQGMYWWKVGTNGFGGPGDGSHTPWGKTAMDVVKHWYLKGGR